MTMTFCGPPRDAEDGIGALTIGGMLGQLVAGHGDREAVVFDEGERQVRWVYGDLDQATRRVARALVRSGVGKGSRVALLMGNRPELLTAFLAATRVGAIAIPLSTFMEPPELARVLRHSDASVLLMQSALMRHRYVEMVRDICDDPLLDSSGSLYVERLPFLRRVVGLGPTHGVRWIENWEEWLRAGEVVPAHHLDLLGDEVSELDDAVIIYTSGTTRGSKGVLHAHRSLALQAWRVARSFRLTTRSRVWSAYPFFWAGGLIRGVLAPLAAGATVVLQEHFEPAGALDLLERERVTSPVLKPHQAARLSADDSWWRRDLSALTDVEHDSILAGHPTVSVPAWSWSSRANYGMTETSTVASTTPVDAGQVAIESAGHGAIVPGMLVRIVDESTGALVDAGQLGEIRLKGPTLMKGYLKVAPEDVFDQDGYYRTGDCGFVDDGCHLHWVGRTTDLIKTGGANVSPVEIEDALRHHPSLERSLAVGVPDYTRGEVVVLCAVRRADAHPSEEDIKDYLRGRLASYKIPQRVVFFDDSELTMTGTGKVRVEQLRAVLAGRQSCTERGVKGRPS